MPFALRQKPKCSACEATESIIWRKGIDDEHLCNECHSKEYNLLQEGNSDFIPKSNGNNGNEHSRNSNLVRKSTRLKPSKYRDFSRKTISTKGKGRRVLFKKNVMRAPTSISTVVTSDYIYDKDQYFQVGDIVSVMDSDDEKIYYAQITGLLRDQYMEKSCVITWLLPTTASPPDRFDPTTYIIGPEEDFPRKLEYFEFICHAPSDYFKQINSPYPTLPDQNKNSFVWSSFGPRIIDTPPNSELFSISDSLFGFNNKDTYNSKEKNSFGNSKKKLTVKEKKERKALSRLEKEST